MQHIRPNIAVDSTINLPIVVRDTVWKDIKSSDHSFVAAVRQCIHKIVQRQFDVGLRVKKLEGINQHIWEARIDRASRLLFTYRQSLDSNGESHKLIAVEAICIDHDDVSRRAKSIDLNWWEAEETRVLGNLDQEFKMLNTEEQQEIQHLWQTEETEIHSHITDELLGNIKWLILEPKIIESDREWQVAIESGEDLQLRLTPDESKLIDTYGNILVSGSAGTGKTTVGLYRLARTMQMYPNAKYLYTAYNPILVKESQEQFKQLWGSINNSPPPNLDFLTIQDLCLKIVQECGEISDCSLVGYQEFYSRYIKKPESRKYPPSLLWDEIRSIIKGGNLQEQTDSYLLSLEEYERLGSKRSGVISKGERDEIHELAEWYQEYLNREKLADEMDLTRMALQAAKRYKCNSYRSIVCDEVQDFTEVQLELLIRLLSKNGQILCAGDINQMISPSGFRWEDLTTRLYERNYRWSKKTLSFNFRNTGKLVSLTLKLLNLKFELLSEKQPREDIAINTNGELARLVKITRDDINHIKLGAADSILVRTEKYKKELKKTLKTELIFTIEESKGLEFDVVYLIDFFEHSKALWDVALNPVQPLREKQKPELRLEFNLLYVAITRARRLLNICEIEIANLWKYPDICDSLMLMEVDKAFDPNRSLESTDDWYARAIYYRDARRLQQALECAIKSGDEDLTRDIEIESLVLAQKYAEAAQLLLKIKRYSEAAELFEKIFELQQASKAWGLAGNLDKETECEVEYLLYNCNKREAIELLITRRKYVEAAKLLQELGEFKDAFELFLKGGHNDQANICKVFLLGENAEFGQNSTLSSELNA